MRPIFVLHPGGDFSIAEDATNEELRECLRTLVGCLSVRDSSLKTYAVSLYFKHEPEGQRIHEHKATGRCVQDAVDAVKVSYPNIPIVDVKCL